MKKICIIGCMLLALIGLGAEDFEDLFNTEKDSIFGSGDIIKEVEDGEAPTPSDLFMASEGVTIGGKFTTSVELSTDPEHIDSDTTAEDFQVDTFLGTTLYIDGRPDEDFRFFAKGSLNYSSDNEVEFQLRELFGDIDINDTIFIRTGKQTINWGVGYFFSPGNLLNLTDINPNDPEAELLGPTAIKAHIPLGVNNIYTYIILGEEAEMDQNLTQIGIAPKLEWVLGGNEISLGGLYRVDNPWNIAATYSGSLNNFSIFAEAVLEGDTDKTFLKEEGSTVVVDERDNSVYFLGTVGSRYSYSDEKDWIDLTMIAQYYYNGLGYVDSQFIADNILTIQSMMIPLDPSVEPDIVYDDLLEQGQHYGAVLLSLTDIGDSHLSPSIFWLGDFVNQTGWTTAAIKYSGIAGLSLSIEYTYYYGSEGSAYAMDGNNHVISFCVKLDDLSF